MNWRTNRRLNKTTRIRVSSVLGTVKPKRESHLFLKTQVIHQRSTELSLTTPRRHLLLDCRTKKPFLFSWRIWHCSSEKGVLYDLQLQFWIILVILIYEKRNSTWKRRQKSQKELTFFNAYSGKISKLTFWLYNHYYLVDFFGTDLKNISLQNLNSLFKCFNL